jgi:hypothetical protein
MRAGIKSVYAKMFVCGCNRARMCVCVCVCVCVCAATKHSAKEGDTSTPYRRDAQRSSHSKAVQLAHSDGEARARHAEARKPVIRGPFLRLASVNLHVPEIQENAVSK